MVTGPGSPVGGPGPLAAGPSDIGLSGERTTRAWARIGLSLLALPSGLLAYSVGRNWLATAAAAFAAVFGLGMLTVSLRRQRATAGMVENRSLALASEQVILTGSSVLLLALSCFVLVSA